MATLKNLNIHDACRDGADYFNSFDTPQDFVKNCNRGDWLLWLFQRTNPAELQLLTLAKAHCANTVRHLMTDERSRNAVDVAIKFGNGLATIEELKQATDAAYEAYAAAYAAAYVAAEKEAAYAAAYAAYAAADEAYEAAYYDAAADEAYEAAYYDARNKNRQLTADICRKYIPIEVWNFGN